MRSTLTLLLCLLLAAPSFGEEESPAAAADARAAGAIGRALLATDPAVRRAAIERLLARLEQGGDLAAFLEAMGAATRDWADRHERLMEVWLHQAVHGKAEERDRAVRLLTALGEKAVQRLAGELRHARLHARPGGASGSLEGEEAPAAASSALESPPALEPATGVPRVYELRDLFEQGMNAVEVRGLLQKTADAVEVKDFKTQFVVTASDAGHAALLERLHDLRVTWRLSQQKKLEPEAAAPTGRETTEREAAEAGAPAAGAPAPPAAVTADEPAPAASPPQQDAETKAARPTPTAWRVTALLFHLPPAAVAWQSQPRSGAPLPIDLRDRVTQVATGRPAAAAAWIHSLQRAPEARAGLPWEGPERLGTAETLRLFSGRHVEYSKSLERTKGGAWTIVMGSVPHGLALELRAKPDGAALDLEVVATRTEVGLPLRVARVKPSPEAAPVELERPEWSTTRTQAHVRLDPDGGSALLGLGALSGDAEECVVVVLTLAPTP